MKNLLVIILIVLSTFCKSQETIRIEFYKHSTGDYDLMIKDALNKNGYKAFVNYGNNEKETDYILEYKTQSREGYDELHKYQIVLFNNQKDTINKVEKTISYFNMGINEPKTICKAIEKLVLKKCNCRKIKEKSEVKYFNISFNVHKIDSTTYSIIAEGAGIRTLEHVTKAFLRKAGQYLEIFDYYIENEEYSYQSTNGAMTFNHNGHRVFGIIKPNYTGKTRKIETKPLEFMNEFE